MTTGIVIISHLLVPEIVRGKIVVESKGPKTIGGDSKKVKKAQDNQVEAAKVAR